MAMGHNFSFEGGEILSRIGAAWFVSYSYYNIIDEAHKDWNFNITENSLKSRKSKYNNSVCYHKSWLLEILKMDQLDKHPNAVGLCSEQIKKMAKEILDKL